MSSSASKEDETGEDLDYHDATSKRKRMMKLDPVSLTRVEIYSVHIICHI